MIFKYIFEDGAVLKLFEVGLSTAEMLKLQELHGKCKVESEVENADSN